jgi:hypothetical protein
MDCCNNEHYVLLCSIEFFMLENLSKTSVYGLTIGEYLPKPYQQKLDYSNLPPLREKWSGSCERWVLFWIQIV